MDYNENKFRYYKDLTEEQLEQELTELYKDLEALEEQYNDDSIKSGSKTYIWEDIKYTNEKIEYIEKILNKNQKTR